MSGLSGTIGKQMTLSQKASDTIVGKKRGTSPIPPTNEQLDIRERFTQATKYGVSVMQDPIKKAAYAAVAKKNQSAYNVAVKDAFTPPEIKSITSGGYHGQPGDTIIVRATDFFKVESVRVGIYTNDGILLEEGLAVLLSNGLDWKYTATTVNAAPAGSRIRVIAIDVPANETVQEVLVA